MLAVVADGPPQAPPLLGHCDRDASAACRRGRRERRCGQPWAEDLLRHPQPGAPCDQFRQKFHAFSTSSRKARSALCSLTSSPLRARITDRPLLQADISVEECEVLRELISSVLPLVRNTHLRSPLRPAPLTREGHFTATLRHSCVLIGHRTMCSSQLTPRRGPCACLPTAWAPPLAGERGFTDAWRPNGQQHCLLLVHASICCT